jgi:hypothetical protein
MFLTVGTSLGREIQGKNSVCVLVDPRLTSLWMTVGIPGGMIGDRAPSNGYIETIVEHLFPFFELHKENDSISSRLST